VLPDRVAPARAPQTAHDAAAGVHGLAGVEVGLVGHRRRQHDRAQLALNSLGVDPEQRLAPDELALLQAHAEPEPRFVRVLGRREIGAPVPVALLEPQRVDGLVADGLDPERPAGGQQRVPHADRMLVVDVQLPAELADVRHPLSADRDAGDLDLSRRHIRKRGVRHVARRDGLEHAPRVGTPDADAGELVGHVAHVHAPVGRQVHQDPAEIARDEVAAGRHAEAIGAPARDGQVALDPAARVEELRVDHAPDRTVHLVVGQTLQERQRTGPAHVELAERGEVEEPDPLADRSMLDADALEEGRP